MADEEPEPLRDGVGTTTQVVRINKPRLQGVPGAWGHALSCLQLTAGSTVIARGLALLPQGQTVDPQPMAELSSPLPGPATQGTCSALWNIPSLKSRDGLPGRGADA